MIIWRTPCFHQTDEILTFFQNSLFFSATQEALDDGYVDDSDDNMDQDPLGDPLDITEPGQFLI